MPRIRVEPPGQDAAWFCCRVGEGSAFLACVASLAFGTGGSPLILMSSPVSVSLATLALVTALLAIFPVVTDLDLSCLEPTLFLPSARVGGAGQRCDQGDD